MVQPKPLGSVHGDLDQKKACLSNLTQLCKCSKESFKSKEFAFGVEGRFGYPLNLPHKRKEKNASHFRFSLKNSGTVLMDSSQKLQLMREVTNND